MYNKTIYGEQIFPESSEPNLKKFKYSGTDNSILYKNLYSPLCNYLIENWTPKTLAPNLITITGFIINTLPIHIYLLIVYGMSVESVLPVWINFLCGFTLLLYLILDNMDGKQARKIGNSTSLGLFFDHGCDAFSVPLLGIVFLHIFGFTGSYFFFIIVLLCFCFYLKTYETFVFKHLDLGLINPVTEGITCLVLLSVFSGFVGNAFWGLESHIWDFKFRDFLFLVLGGFSLFESFSSIFKCIMKIGFLNVYLDLIDFILLCLVTLSLAYSKINYLFVREIKYLAYFYAFLYTKLVLKLIISHIFDIKVRRTQLDIVIPCTILAILHIISHFLDNNESYLYFFDIFFVFLTIAYFFYLFLFWSNVIFRFSQILEIKIFLVNENKEVEIKFDEEDGYEGEIEGTVEADDDLVDEIERSVNISKSLVEAVHDKENEENEENLKIEKIEENPKIAKIENENEIEKEKKEIDDKIVIDEEKKEN